MTTFENGPAVGQALTLKRSPYFLRVTVKADGTVDALDLLEDEPFDDEKIYVYQLTARPSWCHVRRKVGGGFCALARYRMREIQPPDAEIRENTAWQKWARANAPAHNPFP